MTFKYLAKIYRELKVKCQIDGDVLVEAAEDETVIMKQIYWDQRTGELWGFCGKEEVDHKCNPDFAVVVGSGEAGYTELKNAFQHNRIVAGLCTSHYVESPTCTVTCFCCATSSNLQHLHKFRCGRAMEKVRGTLQQTYILSPWTTCGTCVRWRLSTAPINADA